MTALAWGQLIQVDREAFSGAENFLDGSEPLVAPITIDGHAGTAIWHANGVEVAWEVDGQIFTVRGGAHRAAVLASTSTHHDLLAAGFEKDGPVGECLYCAHTPVDRIIDLIGDIGIGGCLEILADGCAVEADGEAVSDAVAQEWERMDCLLRALADRIETLMQKTRVS